MVTRLAAWMVLALGIAVSVSLILRVSVPLANAKEEFTIRFGGGGPVDHPISQDQIAFKKYAEELSGGRLKVEVYHASQLGGIVDMFENVKLGTLTMSHAGTPFVSRVAPLFELVSLPFLFDKRERAQAFVDGPTGGMMSSELEKAGLKAIAWFELGFRHITNSKRPVRTPEDMKGLKIRLQGNPLEMRAFQALGANPTTLDWNELYSGLQQGVVDGQENPFSLIAAMKFYEAQKYLTDTGHTFDFAVVVMNKKFFDGLPLELQKAVSEAARKATEEQRRLTEEANSKAAQTLKEKMQVVNLTDKERDLFRQATRPAYDYARGKFGNEFVDRVIREAK